MLWSFHSPSHCLVIGSVIGMVIPWNFQGARRVANWAVPTILSSMYLHAMFFDPTKIVGDLSPTEPGSDPQDTWNKMSPTAKVKIYVFFFSVKLKRCHQPLQNSGESRLM